MFAGLDVTYFPESGSETDDESPENGNGDQRAELKKKMAAAATQAFVDGGNKTGAR